MESKSFLNNINSKHILKQVFIYSYFEFKSFLKLIKYNKSLQKRLDINIKKYFLNYEYKEKLIEKNEFMFMFSIPNIIIKAIMIVFFLIYLIIFYVKGSFIDEYMKNNCDKNKIKFIEIINNSLIGYLIFLIISILWYILNFKGTILFSSTKKLIISILILLIDIFYYILICVKYNYTNNFIFDNLLKEKNNKFVECWFINYDIIFLIISPIYYITFLFFIFCLKNNFGHIEDHIISILNQFKGVNIIDFEFDKDFNDCNNKEINKLILKNARNYKYKLNKNQIDLIKKINDIRRKYKIPLLKYDLDQRIPHCIINEITEVVLYNDKNIFKLKSFLYLFRYKKNKFINFINNDEILSVITNDLLNKIKIIEQNDTEYILIYNTSSLKNKNNLNQISYNTNENLLSSNRRFNNI